MILFSCKQWSHRKEDKQTEKNTLRNTDIRIRKKDTQTDKLKKTPHNTELRNRKIGV